MKAHPGPIVSGNHFLPKAPLLCVKWIPACIVISRKWTVWAKERVLNHRGTETQRRTKKRNLPPPCLRDSVVTFLRMNIYREAPTELARRCPAGRTGASAPP